MPMLTIKRRLSNTVYGINFVQIKCTHVFPKMYCKNFSRSANSGYVILRQWHYEWLFFFVFYVLQVFCIEKENYF